MPNANRDPLLESYDLDRLPTNVNKETKRPMSLRCLTTLVVVLGLCLIGLSIFTGVIQSKQSRKYECMSEDCIRTACGGWDNDNPAPDISDWDPLVKLNYRVYWDLRDLLEDDTFAFEGTMTSMVKARTFYKSCMDTVKPEEAGLSILHRELSLLGLPPHMPRNWSGTPWYHQEARARHTLGLNTLLEVDVTVDYWNTSRNSLLVGKPKSEEHSDELAFSNNIKTVIKILEPDLDDEQFATDILKFTLSLQNLTLNDTSAAIFNKADIPASMQEGLEGYLGLLFENTTVNLNLTNDSIIVDQMYLSGLSELLNKTDPLSVEKYMFWRVASYLARLMPEFRNKDSEGYRDMISVHQSKQRLLSCINYVQDTFGHALSYAYIQRYFQNSSSTKAQATEMMENVLKAFGSEFESLDWIDDETRLNMQVKLKAIQNTIGSPAYTPEILDSLYDKMAVVEGDFFKSYITLRKVQAIRELEMLRETPSRWVLATLVNAQYRLKLNQVDIPFAILQRPLYGNGFEAIDYGAMGSILGHEVAHGFDDSGRQFDQFGNPNNLLSNASSQNFEKKAQCFVDQYNQYHISATSNLTLDGSKNLDENMADNGGIRAALNAFKLYMQRNSGSERARLPGFTQYDATQMFFLGFAQNFCMTYTKGSEESILKDVHSPGHLRVFGTLSNSQEFADAWNCPAGSRMNPVNKCVLW